MMSEMVWGVGAPDPYSLLTIAMLSDRKHGSTLTSPTFQKTPAVTATSTAKRKLPTGVAAIAPALLAKKSPLPSKPLPPPHQSAPTHPLVKPGATV